MLNLRAINEARAEDPQQPKDCWWIDKLLLPKEFTSYESLAMSQPVVERLGQVLQTAKAQLSDKARFVLNKTHDIFPYQFKLEQVLRSAKDVRAAWSLYRDVEVHGYQLSVINSHLDIAQQTIVKLADALSKGAVEIPAELPNLSDEQVAVDFDKLKITVSGERVKFFADTTKVQVVTAAERLVALDKNYSLLSNTQAAVGRTIVSIGDGLRRLAANETVDISLVHEVVDQINGQITNVNHLLNTCFLLGIYSKVDNVVLTDALSNLK